MKIDKITREDFANKISNEFGIPYTLAYKKIENIISLWSDLILSNDVNISSLGSFNIRQKNTRLGRNPKSKLEYIIKSRKVVSFKKSLKLIL
ncbi:MAG: integration host factor subunit alpha [Pelagibacteraceae bacterium]|nr:integration host factor subunit alpha [Pelagibacteraceae bacterium]|tara:strand:- start:9 stop:284 length:276 start_codon:yes stop_codon:yes gene_type:complete